MPMDKVKRFTSQIVLRISTSEPYQRHVQQVEGSSWDRVRSGQGRLYPSVHWIVVQGPKWKAVRGLVSTAAQISCSRR